VRKGGREVELRPREFDLLMALVRRNGRVTSRMELLQDVWGYTDSVVSRTVDSHVAELRRKLEDDARNPRHIFTLRKRGYRLQR
jgi:DNA-binding response OmpR family regulator